MNASGAAPSRISVVIPTWNDRAHLARLLPALVRLETLHEVIVVDAADDAATAEVVRAAGAVYLRAPEPNRGAQMNLGAARASGEAVIFHHADGLLQPEHVSAIAQALRDTAVVGGGFYSKLDLVHPGILWLEKGSCFMTVGGGVTCFV